jgi:anhydro-N-acetylmuramic acid kinase
MSGTSADGIDAAVVDLWREKRGLRVELRGFETTPYPPAVRDLLFRCFADQATASELCALNALLGDLFADAAEGLLKRHHIPRSEVSFLASHGQTVWHQPTPDASAPSARGTLQLGEAARIAERLRRPVVCDFRQQDLALGGQGAPLVPFVDHLLLSDPAESRAVQNLGGIGNVTYLRAGGALKEVIAFDTGPGNALMDAAAVLVTGGRETCDRDGRVAASAPVDAAFLQELLAEPYLHQPPPKSTGRELFSAARVKEWWDRGHRGPELVSTLTQFTVETVALSYRRWLGTVHTVILGGGGARNAELVRRLRTALSPAEVRFPDEFGFDADAKEAVAFAVLGCATYYALPSNVPSATGASRPAVQGKICMP